MEVACNLEVVMQCPFQQFTYSYQGMSTTHNSRPTPLVPAGLHVKGVKPDTHPEWPMTQYKAKTNAQDTCGMRY